jgi:uncharacterized protein involved in propanediol utilization
MDQSYSNETIGASRRDRFKTVQEKSATLLMRTLEQSVSNGHGVCGAHHGELFQGQIVDQAGVQRRCLVSLPCNQLYSKVLFRPNLTGTIEVAPAHKTRAKRTAELILAYLNLSFIGGRLEIDSNIVEGKGNGSSTADCVAVGRAVVSAIGWTLTETELARLVVQAETASDSVMFGRAVLFAQRDGVVVEDYARSLPNMEVLGIDTDQNGAIDTLLYPPAVYSWREIQSFETIISALRRSILLQDVELLGRVATASAIINETFLPKPMFQEILCLVKKVGALGIAAAHSGTILGILLDPHDALLARKIEFLKKKLAELNIVDVFRFQSTQTYRGRYL